MLKAAFEILLTDYKPSCPDESTRLADLTRKSCLFQAETAR